MKNLITGLITLIAFAALEAAAGALMAFVIIPLSDYMFWVMIGIMGTAAVYVVGAVMNGIVIPAWNSDIKKEKKE